MKRFRKPIKIAAIVLAILAALILCDLTAVYGMHRKPIFCFSGVTADDGGSGRYVGAGYWFDLRGSLKVDEGYKVKEADFYLLGFALVRGKTS